MSVPQRVEFWTSPRSFGLCGADKRYDHKGEVLPLTLTIKLSDEQATALETKAAAEGLSVEEWIKKLAEPEQPASRPPHHIADIIVENMKDVPPEIMATMPKDGASQHDQYIYGWPKKPE